MDEVDIKELVNGEGVRVVIKKYDRSGDGRITFLEFIDEITPKNI